MLSLLPETEPVFTVVCVPCVLTSSILEVDTEATWRSNGGAACLSPDTQGEEEEETEVKKAQMNQKYYWRV